MAEHHTYRDDGIQINLVCCTEVLLQDIATKEATQKDVALTYAMAIKSEAQRASTVDWPAVNKAILARWSMSGLERIKKRAFDILAGKINPSATTGDRRNG